MKFINNKPVNLKWIAIPAIIFYGLYFTIGGDLWGTLGLLFLLLLLIVGFIRAVRKLWRNETLKIRFGAIVKFCEESYPPLLRNLLIIAFIIFLFLIAKSWVEVQKVETLEYQTNPGLYWSLRTQMEAKQEVLFNYFLIAIAIMVLTIAVPVIRFLWLKGITVKKEMNIMSSFQKYLITALGLIILLLIAVVWALN